LGDGTEVGEKLFGISHAFAEQRELDLNNWDSKNGLAC